MSNSVDATLISIRNKIKWLEYSNKYLKDPHIEGLIWKLNAIREEIEWRSTQEK